jgi:hypothetical protein
VPDVVAGGGGDGAAGGIINVLMAGMLKDAIGAKRPVAVVEWRSTA